MFIFRGMIAAAALLGLAACAEQNVSRDYDSSARCHDSGLKAGTPEFGQCVKDEHASRLLQQQREEYEQQKQDLQDWRRQRGR